jgi:hypothetical protein
MSTAPQATGRNRTMIVITADLMMFKMEAERWEDTPMVSSADTKSIKVYKAEPGRETPSKLIAEFTEVRAVYFDAEAELMMTNPAPA